MGINFFFGTMRLGLANALAFGLAMTFVLLLLFGLQEATKPAHAATTFTVNSTGDENDLDFLPSGTFDGSSDGECDVDSATGDQCTLRAAIQEANVTPNVGGPDLIDFAIPEDPNDPADDVKTILVGGTPSPSADTSLPSIREAMTINGYSQSGASPNTNTDLADGTNANLLIELNGALTGPSGSPGLRIETSNVVVKGLVINRFNAGIFISGDGSGNRIEGNFIGTDPFGGTQNAVGNRDYGVTVFGSSRANIIGGTDADDGTVDGVVEARNLISGNLFRGLQIFGNGGNKIQGNLIGTKANGIDGLGNGREGVQIFSPNNTVGNSTGDNEAGANLIAFNGRDGVQVSGGLNSTFAVGNRILSNSIFSNGGPAEGALGIDLDGGEGFSNPDGDGVTANDTDDPDTGPNSLQNFPVLTSVSRSGLDGSTTIEGTLNSTASTTFTVQFFSNPSAEPSNHGEGKTYLGQKSDVTTDPSGNASFTFTIQENVALGHFVTATATRLDTSTNPATPTNTSEFSEVEEVIEGNDPPVNSVPGAQSADEDSPLVFSGANGNQISISDPDAGSSPVQVRLQVDHATMTLDGDDGLTFDSGDSGTNDADMTFTGTITDINVALDGMRFDPEANYNGSATLTITTADQGNTGGGGPKTDSDNVNITVNPFDDDPVANNDPNKGSYRVKAGKTLSVSPASGILANDFDADGNTLTVADADPATAGIQPFSGPSKGKLTLNANGSFTYKAPRKAPKNPLTFAYRANDGTSDSNVATVSIKVRR